MAYDYEDNDLDDCEGKVEDYDGSILDAADLRRHIHLQHGIRTADLSDYDLASVHAEQH